MFTSLYPKTAEEKNIRIIAVENLLYYSATDLAKALGYANPRTAVSRHVDPNVIRRWYYPTDSGMREMLFIPESAALQFCLRCNNPGVAEFTDTLFRYAIPEARKRLCNCPMSEDPDIEDNEEDDEDDDFWDDFWDTDDEEDDPEDEKIKYFDRQALAYEVLTEIMKIAMNVAAHYIMDDEK